MGKRTVKRYRVFVHDARDNGSYLRATWHPERGVFVLSTWYDDVCTGAIRLRAADAADLVSLLVDGLGDLAGVPGRAGTAATVAAAARSRPSPTGTTRPRRAGGWPELRSRLATWLATRVAGPAAAPPPGRLPRRGPDAGDGLERQRPA